MDLTSRRRRRRQPAAGSQRPSDTINDSGANREYNLDEPTMEEKLDSLNLLRGGDEAAGGTEELPLSTVVPPTADSIHVLLKQALRAADHASLLNCLYNSDRKIIANSVSLLTPADVVKLLKFFILLMQSRGAVLVCLLPWMQALLSQHMGTIVSQESSLLLNSLYHLIDARTSTFKQSLQLSTSLDFLFAEVNFIFSCLIDARTSTFKQTLQLSTSLDFLFAEIDNDESGEEEGDPPIIYEDKETEDEESEGDTDGSEVLSD